MTGGQAEHVIPVAADIAAARNVTGGHLQAGDLWQRGRQQAALQDGGGRAVKLCVQGLHGHGRTVGGQLQQIHVLGGEDAAGQRADMQYTDDGALGPQRGTHQGPYSFASKMGLTTLV